MKIISWNVNGLRATLNAGHFAPLRDLAPDVLAVQEIRTKHELPEVLPGYEHFYNPAEREGYSGTLLMAKPGILADDPQFGLPGIGDPEGRTITADLGAAYFVAVYVPHSVGDLARNAFRVRWQEALIGNVETLQEIKPVILAGDLNAAHNPTLDVYDGNPRADEADGFATDERGLHIDLEDLGMADVYRALNPTETDCFTWWSLRRNRRAVNRGWRLDYFYASEELMPYVSRISHHTDIQGSDHCPIELEASI